MFDKTGLTKKGILAWVAEAGKRIAAGDNKCALEAARRSYVKIMNCKEEDLEQVTLYELAKLSHHAKEENVAWGILTKAMLGHYNNPHYWKVNDQGYLVSNLK